MDALRRIEPRGNRENLDRKQDAYAHNSQDSAVRAKIGDGGFAMIGQVAVNQLRVNPTMAGGQPSTRFFGGRF